MKKYLLISLIGLIATNTHAQINPELKDIITQSFGYFSKIKEAELGVKTSEEKLKLTSLSKTPDINFNSSYNFIMPKISFPINGNEIQFAPVHNLASSVGTNYTIYDFGRLKSAIEKSKTDILISKDNVDILKNQLANQVAVVYYNIVYLKQAISIQDSVIGYFKSNKQLAENKLKNGEGVKLDVLNLESNIDAEENKKIDLENLLQKQMILLDYTSGKSKIIAADFDFNLNDLNDDSLFNIVKQNNPEFSLSKNKILLSNNELNLIKLNNKPKVSLNAATGIRNGYMPEVNNLRFNYMAGILISVPIYGFGKINQQVQIQKSLVKQNELSEQSLEATYKKDINQLLADIKSNQEKIKHIEAQIESAKSAQEITASRYQNGVATYLEIIAAALNTQKATLSKLQNEYQICLSKIELSKLMGYQFWMR
jgi:outer membrane protein TolC